MREQVAHYVVRAFNEDKPYDQFVTEQIAGDVGQLNSADLTGGEGFRPVAERGELDRWVLSELNRAAISSLTTAVTSTIARISTELRGALTWKFAVIKRHSFAWNTECPFRDSSFASLSRMRVTCNKLNTTRPKSRDHCPSIRE